MEGGGVAATGVVVGGGVVIGVDGDAAGACALAITSQMQKLER